MLSSCCIGEVAAGLSRNAAETHKAGEIARNVASETLNGRRNLREMKLKRAAREAAACAAPEKRPPGGICLAAKAEAEKDEK